MGKMRNRQNGILGTLHCLLRDPAIDLLFIVGLVMSFFIVFHATDYIIGIQEEIKQDFTYAYTTHFSIYAPYEVLEDGGIKRPDQVWTPEQLSTILKYLQEIPEGNIGIYDAMTIGLSSERAYINMELVMNEPFRYSIEEGKFPGKELSNGILIGESLRSYVTEAEDGTETLYLDGEAYSISGWFRNMSSAGVDHRIYTNWNILSPERKQKILEKLARNLNVGIAFRVESDRDWSAQLEAFSGWLQENFELEIDLWDTTVSMDQAENEWYHVLNRIFLVVSFAFSLVNCSIIADLWVCRRRQELMVRKAFGYCTRHLFVRLLREASKLAVIAGVITVVFNGAYTLLWGNSLDFGIQTLWKSLWIVLGMAVVLLITVLFPMHKVHRLDPAEGFCEL